MHYTVRGEIAQYVEIALEPGVGVWSSKGSIMAYSAGVQWRLRVPGGVGGGE